MGTNETNPGFAAIEQHIRRAGLEWTVALAAHIAAALSATGRGLKKFASTMGDGYLAELDRRAIEADAFLKRSVPHY